MARRKITQERKRSYAQAMRDNPTPAEEALRRAMWMAGMRPQRQKILCGYIVDFYFARSKLIVEVDGYYHFTKKGRTSDRIRTNVLIRDGYRVIRLTNARVLADPDAAAQAVRRAL